MAILLHHPVFKVLDADGVSVAGAKLYFYLAGTSTPQAVYSDVTGVTPLANPVVCDSRGEAIIWLGNFSYKINATTSADVQLANFPIDYITGFPGGGLTNALVSTVAVPSVNGAGVLTASGLIPARTRVVGVSCELTTGFGATGGLTSIALGDSTALDRWGVSAAITTGSKIGGTDAAAAAQMRANELPIYANATAVLLSGLGGTFDTTGVAQVTVHYFTMPHRTS